ncbi:MAG: hypothetical protein LBI36_00035 [Oscillospiraceae bacterium]|jgi:hypothetical protein|nr:hypothetical protein [Oscillospiraceae bacterium]
MDYKLDRITFSCDITGDPRDALMRDAVNQKVADATQIGAPTALYDDARNCPYLQYPDGRRVYELD